MTTTRRTRSAAAGCLAAGLLVALAGCVPDSGGVPGQLERGLESADSNAQTALLALRELSGGRTSPQHAHIAVDDAITKLGQQQNSLASLEPETRSERRWQRSTDQAISSLDAALKDARSATAGSAGVRWSAAQREVSAASRTIDRTKRTIVRQAGDHE